MHEGDMASFLSGQLDFIFFFYGLAFLLLGITCWSIGDRRDRTASWSLLGGFALVHGLTEWLDLTALIVGDNPAFALTRMVLMTGSFLLLLDFARVEGIRLGWKLPGRWIYVPLILLIGLVEIWGSLTAAGIVARYSVGFFGAAGVSLVFVWRSRSLSGAAKWFALSASVGFGLYAVAAGLIVPAGSFPPSTILNYATFTGLTGLPIQLVRGILACWIAFSVWAVWGEGIATEMSSPRYTEHVREQFIWTVVTMTAILIAGWTLTDFLGGIHRANVEEEASGDIDLLASRLAGETAMVEGMVKTLAGSPSILPLLTGGTPADSETARSFLKLNVVASGARRSFILDRAGTVVASSHRGDTFPEAPRYGSVSYFRDSMAGRSGYQFVFSPRDGGRYYYASEPVRTADGGIVGVAVLAKSLDRFEADLRRFARPYFFIDPNGVVVMTNRPQELMRALWPLPRETITDLSRQFGAAVDGRPLMEREIVDSTWTNVKGERDYVRRRFDGHTRWSLVILKPTREIFASRLLGIIITLLVALMALIYLAGRGRWVHDDVQTDNRAKLQELADDLGVKATTDALTGLHNRMMFEQALISEMTRSDRHDAPLSLLLFDVDHFKRVNDTYGHLAGDKVLVRLSRFVANLVRTNDFLARWGGEEFVILLPETDGKMAFQVAEKLRMAITQVIFDEAGSVTCSFGATQYVPGETGAQFVSRADSALYIAKANGRNRVEMLPPTRPRPELISVG